MRNEHSLSVFGLALVISLSFSSPSKAELIFNIDTTAKELWVSGSDSGDLNDGGKFAQWSIFDPVAHSDVFAGNQAFVGFNDDGDSNFGGVVVSTTGFGGGSPTRQLIVILADADATSTAVSLTGAETKSSYAALHPNDVAWLEGLIGSSVPSIAGTGFQSVAIQAASGGAAIPEPSTISLLGACGLIACLRRRRV